MRVAGYSALLLLACLVASPLSRGQGTSWPQRPVRVVVPLAPGGSVDTVARYVSARLSAHFGQQFIVDNRAGAGGVVGNAIVAGAEPDGYTLLMISGGYAGTAALHEKLPYDPVKDIAPVALIASGPLWLAAYPSVAATDTKRLIELARAKPDNLNYGSGGAGTFTHLTMELFCQMTGARMVHVPYKGGGAAIADLLGGRLQLYMAPGPLVIAHVKAGKLRALGVTSEKRARAAPEVPTIAETVPGYVAAFPYGVAAPGRTPRAVVAKLNAALGAVLAEPELVERLRAGGNEPARSSPEAFAREIREDIAKWRRVVKQGNIRAQ
ncbi:MAG: tripartite tricarboxylate transporter substrate binding protein [Burkholderiales bacterium]|nr:tripartite tricarboxylate transporter substrate binding protein [Burkholderiales bacterium]